MKKTAKKLISLLLVVTMMMSSMAVIASAVTDDTVEIVSAKATRSLIEGDQGYVAQQWISPSQFVEYFCYDVAYSQPYFVLTVGDGQKVEGYEYDIVSFFNHDVYWSFSDSQSYYNEWKAGNSYEAVAELYTNSGELVAECTFDVEIIENPIESIMVEEFTLTEFADGYWSSRYNNETGKEEDYFYYYINEEINFSVKLKDGEVIYSDRGPILINDEWYNININIDQYNQPLKQGKNEISVSILGIEGTCIVNVLESPVKEVIVDDISVIENAKGDFAEHYIPETDSFEEIFIYDLSDIEFTVIFKDGTRRRSSNGEVSYDGKVYRLDVEGQHNNPLKLGDNELDFKLGGYSGNFNVTVKKSPIKSVIFEPIYIVEKTNGYFVDETRNTFEYLLTGEDFSCTVELADGSRMKSEDGKVVFDNTKYYITLADNQNSRSLNMGKNIVPVSVCGRTVDAVVNIIPSPVKRITAEPIRLLLSEAEYSDWSNEPEFDWYEKIFCKVEFNDGSELVLSARAHETRFVYTYKNREYCLELWDDSDIEEGLKPGINKIQYAFMGKTVTIDIELYDDVSSPFIYDEVYGGVVITGYTGPETDILEVPSEINGKPVIGIAKLGRNIGDTLKIPDSVKFLADDWLRSVGTLKNLYLGKGINNFNADMINSDLEYIEISKSNEYYCSIDGVLYSKDRSTVVAYPPKKGNVYEVPSFVSNIDIFMGSSKYNTLYRDIEVVIPEDSKNFITVDGIMYSEDMTKVLWCDPEKTGDYDMPDSVVEIAGKAFEGSSLDSISISPNVTEIVYATFSACPELKSVELPESVKSIEEAGFGDCSSLESINLSEVNYLGFHAFGGCKSIDNIELSDELTEAAWAFSGCTGLKSVKIPSGIKEISIYMFSGCTGLSQVKIPEGVESIGSYAFYNTGITTLTVPKSLKEIGSYAFARCEKLTKAVIDADVKVIQKGCFLNCPNLTEVIIGDSVTDIEQGSFKGCLSLSKITLPQKLRSVDTCLADTAYCKEKGNIKDGLIYIGDILIDAEPAVSGRVKIKDGTHIIADGVFSGNTEITEVVFPDSLRIIGDYAFAHCSSLSRAKLSDGLEIIGMWAFIETALEKVVVPDSVTDMVYSSFALNPISEIDMPETAVNFGYSIFGGTTWYDEQPEGFVYLENVLYDYKGVIPTPTEIVVPDGVKSIAGAALERQSNITSVTLPDSVEIIGKSAFLLCQSLRDIKLSENLKLIDNNAFTSCALEEITLPDSLEKLGDHVFMNTGITSLDLPVSLRSIGKFTFEGSKKLERINVDENNPWFTSIDGVLYNKEGTKVIACPEGRKDTVFLSEKVTGAENWAFHRSQARMVVIKNPDFVFGRSFDSDNPITICAPENSTAHRFALAHGYPFIVYNPEDFHEHDYKETVTVNPGCETDGEVVMECECGDVRKEVLRATGHIGGEWFVTVQPTYVSDGKMVQKCTVCDKIIKELPIEKLTEGKVFSVSISDITLNYKDSSTITPDVVINDGIKYSVTYSSSDPKVAQVDENGNVYATGKGETTITITVTDELGNTVTDTCKVQVKYTFWQWLIVIVLFGWIWY
jgi:hypothetical protein